MTDELLLLYLDTAQDRLADQAALDHEMAVESVRIGWLTAHDRRAYSSWRSAIRRLGRRPAEGLTGAALEAAVMALGATNPDVVKIVTV